MQFRPHEMFAFNEDQLNNEMQAKLAVALYASESANPNTLRTMNDESLQKLANKLAYQATLSIAPRRNYDVGKDYVKQSMTETLRGMRKVKNKEQLEGNHFAVTIYKGDGQFTPYAHVYAPNKDYASAVYTSFEAMAAEIDEEAIIYIAEEPDKPIDEVLLLNPFDVEEEA